MSILVSFAILSSSVTANELHTRNTRKIDLNVWAPNRISQIWYSIICSTCIVAPCSAAFTFSSELTRAEKHHFFKYIRFPIDPNNGIFICSSNRTGCPSFWIFYLYGLSIEHIYLWGKMCCCILQISPTKMPSYIWTAIGGVLTVILHVAKSNRLKCLWYSGRGRGSWSNAV